MKIEEIFVNANENSLAQAKNWLLLGLGALIAAGLFSVLLVLSRTPAIQEIIPFIDFFHIALVVHVNLSVLIWFMAFACVLWSLSSQGNLHALAQLGFYVSLLGTLILILGPFFGVGKPILNNYIPTLDHKVFFISLIVFCVGVAIRILISLISTRVLLGAMSIGAAIRMSIFLGCFVTVLAIWSLWKSYQGLPADLEREAYFEFLYWGSGHVLQFNHSLLMLMAWLILLLTGGRIVFADGRLIFLLALLSVLPTFYAIKIYGDYDVYTPEHRLAFTELMRWGGLTTLPLGLFLAYIFVSSTPSDNDKTNNAHLNAAFICSVVLFLTGGVIGFLIDGVNVVIPAHYHGSIVGVTLSFMGLAYVFLPLLGYGLPNVKLAKIQLYTYSAGQMMHIIGLAWSGGYGVQRKTAGAAQGLERIEQVAGMGLMGLGGLVSIIGGVLFLVVMIVAMREGGDKQIEDSQA